MVRVQVFICGTSFGRVDKNWLEYMGWFIAL